MQTLFDLYFKLNTWYNLLWTPWISRKRSFNLIYLHVPDILLRNLILIMMLKQRVLVMRKMIMMIRRRIKKKRNHLKRSYKPFKK